ncbi:TonB-dependent receptor [uncultured Abyssibacter sp.]|uniref:TonB-dependent receptor n=1 Tax=uncultured Abyssibacter sp. TaxID=2320202 RepID=UPI0032B15DCA
MTGIRPRIRASTRMIAVIVLACAQGAAWSQSPDEPSADGEGEALDFLFEESGTSEADKREQTESEETPARTAQPYEETIPLPQEPATAASTSPRPRSIEEIVVTARRTEENLQDVPVAIAAMSSDDLKREQINSPSDLNGRVPSLVISSGSQMRNTETPTIRGQGAQYGASPGVIIYLAEVPMPSDPVANYQGGPGKFFDLGNLQVLKGSQGTLFGRNTTGGALLLEPQRPLPEFSGSLGASTQMLSEDDLRGERYEAVFNTPLLGDRLLARFGGQMVHRDGFTKDVVTGKDYDDKNYWTARAGLLWQPSDRVSNYLMGNWADGDTNGTATVIERINREGLNQAIPGAIGLGGLTRILPGIDLGQVANLGCLILNVFGPSTNCGQDIIDEQAARGIRRVELSGDPNDILKTASVMDKLSIGLTDNLSLINIASYSTLEHSYRWDLDGSRAGFNEFINPEDVLQADVRTITEELQLQGAALDGALNYVVGGYYENTEASGRIIATSLLFVEVDQRYTQSKESFAPFAQGTYHLGDLFEGLSGLNLTLGVRRTTDKTSGAASITQVAAGLIPLVDKSFEAEVDNAEWTYTAGLDYKLDSHLLYGKVSRGYKTGGIATISVNPARYTYDPEFVTNYELGHKSDFLIADVLPLRVNSAVYYTDYTGLQKASIDAYVDPDSPSPVPQLGQSIFNVGSAWVAGFETDITIQPLPGLTLLGTYGYTRAEYEEFSLFYSGASPQLDCSGEAVEGGNMIDLSCIPFQSTPEHQFSISGRYLLPLDPDNGDVEVSLTYAWTDEQYSGQSSPPEAEPGAWIPSSKRVNASLSWSRILGSGFDARLWATNLTDEVDRISNSNQWNLTYFQSSFYSEPRIIGLDLSYDW